MDLAAEAVSFLAEIPFRHRASADGVEGELQVTEELLVPSHGGVRISVLASAADVITGVLTSTATAPAVALTTDLAVRVLRPIGLGRLTMACRVVKQGRTLASTEAWFHDGEHIAAHAWLTFMASPRPQDTLPQISLDREVEGPGMREPFADALGIKEVRPGLVEVSRRPYTLQPAGTLQGGVICALAECAAESLSGRAVKEIDVRYLSAVRKGPGRATAEALDADTAKVKVVDAGCHDDRIASVGFARFRAG